MAKRFTKSAINWVELEKRVPPHQKTQLLAFKAKVDMHIRRVLAHPPELPKINWDEYMKVTDSKIVNNFKSQYEAFKVPFPEDKVSSKIDEEWKKTEPEIKKFCDEVQKDIEQAQKELERIKALPKFDDITLEMFYDLYPDLAIDPVNRPTFWPHTPEEQPGYKSPELLRAEEAARQKAKEKEAAKAMPEKKATKPEKKEAKPEKKAPKPEKKTTPKKAEKKDDKKKPKK